MDIPDSHAPSATKQKLNKLLLKSAKEGNLNELQLAINQGAKKNAKTTKGLTTLHLAVKNNHREISSKLLAAGAKLSKKNLTENEQNQLHTIVDSPLFEPNSMIIIQSKPVTMKRIDPTSYLITPGENTASYT